MGLDGERDVQKSRNHRNKGFLGSPISKSNTYKFKLNRDNIKELSSTSFPTIYHENGSNIAKKYGFCQVFQDFLKESYGPRFGEGKPGQVKPTTEFVMYLLIDQIFLSSV